MKSISIVWFRRDLRLKDNAALYHALKNETEVFPIFIFDRNILDKLEQRDDRRVTFIHGALLKMQKDLIACGTTLHTYYGKPVEIFQELISQYTIKAVYTNHDYEPYATERDQEIKSLLEGNWISFHTYKDHVIFEYNEVLKADGKPYTVYTPYSRTWKAKLNDFYLKPYPTEKYFHHFLKQEPREIHSLEEMGFEFNDSYLPPYHIPLSIIKNYHKTRDIPAIEGTSRLGIHLRFGTVSVRQCAKIALESNEKFLNELIWRDFYQQILWHFPHVVGNGFNRAYDAIKWNVNMEHFEAWKNGETGYPIVDAGMRQLKQTGWMHNRVRMIVASFLTKHLFIDWRLGEAHFANYLQDFDLASNNGGWQWAAGSGVDAAPYFRIFNPKLQTEKFDPDNLYIKQWVPEFGTEKYPAPIVEHTEARAKCLEKYKLYLNK